MKINMYFLFAFIYFFMNSLGLPLGLTYTVLASPLLYCWLLTRGKEILLPFFIALSPFLVIHFLLTVNSSAYLISIANYTAVYIGCHAFYAFLQTCQDPESIFRKLLILNFIFCLIAIPVYFTALGPVLWMQQALSISADSYNRLKLFTYEPSYYAVLFTPLFFFFLLQLILQQNKMNSWLLLSMLCLPYLLSFSVGVLGAVLFALLSTWIICMKTLTQKKRMLNLLALASVSGLTILVILAVFYPQNSLFLRIHEISAGDDTSGKGRTFEAFLLAKQILEQKSVIWGVGPGQIKLLGADIIRSYYLYTQDYTSIAIPNAAAETLAIFGWLGFLLRLTIEVTLFCYTRVWNNYYRLLLFLFIFLYQFTGSYITNMAEYVIWILAFTNVFPAFDVKRSRPAYYPIFKAAVQ